MPQNGTFYMKLGATPFVAPCKAGEGTVDKIKFYRGATKNIMLADTPRKVFTIDTKMGDAQVQYFWSSKGLEAFILNLRGDFALFLPAGRMLLKYPSYQCK